MSDERCPCTTNTEVYRTVWDSTVMCDRCVDCGRLIVCQLKGGA